MPASSAPRKRSSRGGSKFYERGSMPPAGNNRILARWREVGEWWSGEPQREIERYIDDRGIRREKTIELPPVTAPYGTRKPKPYIEDNTEEISLRIKKTRDEKVAKACGYLEEYDSRFDEKENTYADHHYLDSM